VQALVAVVDRLVVINFGRLLADGEPRRVMADRRCRTSISGFPA